MADQVRAQVGGVARRPAGVRGSGGERAADALIYAAIAAFCIAVLYPFFYTVINSLNADLPYGPTFLWPDGWTLTNYRVVFREPNLAGAFSVTVARTLVGVVLVTCNCAMAGFALRKKRLTFRKAYLAILLIPLFFQGGLIPTYLNYRRLGLLDNFLVFIIPQMFAFFYLIIFMSGFDDIPDSLEESAKVDGAGYFTIFARIYLPLALPILATISLFEGVAQWNAWFDSVYFTNSSRLMTLPALLLRVVKGGEVEDFLRDPEAYQQQNPDGIKLAMMVVAVLPITLAYPFLQRYFIKGLTLGSLKG